MLWTCFGRHVETRLFDIVREHSSTQHAWGLIVPQISSVVATRSVQHVSFRGMVRAIVRWRRLLFQRMMTGRLKEEKDDRESV